MDSKEVKLQGYGNSKLWQEIDYNNRKKIMQISWTHDKEGRTGKCGYFGGKSQGHMEDNGLNFLNISKTPIQRNKFLSRVMQELSWHQYRLMAQEEDSHFLLAFCPYL